MPKIEIEIDDLQAADIERLRGRMPSPLFARFALRMGTNDIRDAFQRVKSDAVFEKFREAFDDHLNTPLPPK